MLYMCFFGSGFSELQGIIKGRTNYRRTAQDTTGQPQDSTGHSADVDAVSWLTSYGSWHAYEKKIVPVL